MKNDTNPATFVSKALQRCKPYVPKVLYRRIGDRFFKREHYELALLCYGDTIRSNDRLRSGRLGICYGKAGDEERMEHFLARAADLGSRDAMALLAEHFYTVRNSEKAACWARRMRAAGMDEAKYLLIGSLQALERYDEELIGLLQELAEQGDREARFALGTCYLEGKGVPQDHAKAMVWYLLAARQGHPTAQNNVGYMYGERLIPSPRPDAAAVWYLRAASNGSRLGQENLEEFYRKKSLEAFSRKGFRSSKRRSGHPSTRPNCPSGPIPPPAPAPRSKN